MAAPQAQRRAAPRKRGLGVDVLTAARTRISRVFDDAPRVTVSFSGGKDSGVVLELAAQEARRRGRKIGVLIVDLEAQYKLTIDYIHRMLDRHADVVEPYWVCLPLNLRNAVSHYQPNWQCWDPDEEERWVRPMPDHPGVVSDPSVHGWDWFERGMEFEDFTPAFADWYSQGKLCFSLVGIRAQESLNRWRTIATVRKRMHEGLRWTTWLQGSTVYNAYPIYDWSTKDVWRFYGKTKTPYNPLYDRMHKAGVSLHQQRICHPYGDDQKRGLWLYHIVEPETWGRVAARVQGANYGAKYAQASGNITGKITITKPEGMTWQKYAEVLLESMPPPTAEHYKNKIQQFLRWYHERGYPNGSIPDDGPLDRKHPSWKRIVKVLLSFDYYCKGLSFSPTNKAAKEQLAALRRRQRAEYNFPVVGIS